MSIIKRLQMPALGAAFLALVAWASCRNPNIELTPKEQVWYDSLVTALESQYTSESPSLGYDRYGCVALRANAALGHETTSRLAEHLEPMVRARQSMSAQQRRDSLLTGDHPIPLDDPCPRIDSLWYASLRQVNRGR
jgi:hypothetical protein